MNATDLYDQLEKDFITPSLSDNWAEYMLSISDYLTENFKKRSMGLVCDNSKITNKVYTAVFPSSVVMQSIIDKEETDIVLFVHHPSIWDIRKAHETFQQMDKDLLQLFKERKISIYNLHVPLDNYGPYSTSVTLAKALEIDINNSFHDYFGGLCGVIGKTGFSSVKELKDIFESVVEHRVSLYQYGTDEIEEGMVAVVAGGGNTMSVLEEIVEEGVNTFLTGITVRNEHSEISHRYAEDTEINILGGTHYSTEKPACQAICDYFVKLGLPSEFIEDVPVLEDL